VWTAFVHHVRHQIIRTKRNNFQQLKCFIGSSLWRNSTNKRHTDHINQYHQYQLYHHDCHESSHSNKPSSSQQQAEAPLKQTRLRERKEHDPATQSANILVSDPEKTLQNEERVDMLQQMHHEHVHDQRQPDADDIRLKKIGIIAYGDGFWKTTDHEIVVGSIMLTPTYAFLWEANSWDEVTVDSILFTLFINPKPELVIFGSGQEVQRPNDDVEDWLYENQVKYEVYDSPQAASVFTQLNDENRRVVAFLIAAEFPDEDMAKRFLAPKDYRRPDLDPEYEREQERKKAEREKRRIERHRRK